MLATPESVAASPSRVTRARVHRASRSLFSFLCLALRASAAVASGAATVERPSCVRGLGVAIISTMFLRAFVRAGEGDGAERAALIASPSSVASLQCGGGDAGAMERGCSMTEDVRADVDDASTSRRARGFGSSSVGVVVMAVCVLAIGAVAIMMTGHGGAARGVAALGKAAQAEAPQPEARPEAFTCYVAAEAKAAAALGELRGTLPNGCLKGKCIDVTESGRRIADVGEHIYVICMQCDKLRVPLEWAEKVTFVRGEFVDGCYKGAKDHWHKASMSHVHAMNDARANAYNTITIIEEDAATKEPSEMGREFDIDQIVNVLHSDSRWHVARVGYRPYFFENQRLHQRAYGCPEQCKCNAVAKHAWMIAGGECDIRSSDFYLVRMDYAFPIQQMVQVQGSTIDMEALQRVKNQFYVVPQLSYQDHLDATLEQQFNMGTRFRDMCFVPGATTELGAKKSTTEDASSSSDSTTDSTADGKDDIDAETEYNSDAATTDDVDTDVATIGAADVFGSSDFSTLFLGDI